jgi:hypothetical protein
MIVAALLGAAVVMAPTTTGAKAGVPGKGKPSAGARSLGDPLFPQLGNGGYDVEHYTIEIDYDPVANRLTRRPRRSSPPPRST